MIEPVVSKQTFVIINIDYGRPNRRKPKDKIHNLKRRDIAYLFIVQSPRFLFKLYATGNDHYNSSSFKNTYVKLVSRRRWITSMARFGCTHTDKALIIETSCKVKY